MLNFDSFDRFLTPEECAQIDQTLLPARDRFSIRIAVYSWRYLQEVSQGLGIGISELQPQQIEGWLRQDSSLQANELADESFMDLFSRLLISSLTPLQKIAQQDSVEIEALTLPQIISWFENQVKATL